MTEATALKALSLPQPWSLFVASGKLPYVPRLRPTEHRGRLLIHASREIPETVTELCLDEPYKGALAGVWPKFAQARWDSDRRSVVRALPRGQLIGEVDVLAVVPYHQAPRELRKLHRKFGYPYPTKWLWLTTGWQVYSVPIPHQGHKRIFNVQLGADHHPALSQAQVPLVFQRQDAAHSDRAPHV